MLKRHGARQITVKLGAWGAQSEKLVFCCFRERCFRKPVTIYTTAPYLDPLGIQVDPLQRQAQGGFILVSLHWLCTS